MSSEDKPKVRARSQAKAKGGKKKGTKKKGVSSKAAPKKRKGGNAAGIFLGLAVVGIASWFVFGNPEIVPKKKPPAKQNIAKALKTGKPDPARLMVLRALSAIRPYVEDCYRFALSKSKGLEGVVVVEFMADWNGKKGFISEAHIMEPRGGPPVLEECLAETVSDVPFVAPKKLKNGQQRVVFPFAFDTVRSERTAKKKK
jgi:hypothetical protein